MSNEKTRFLKIFLVGSEILFQTLCSVVHEVRYIQELRMAANREVMLLSMCCVNVVQQTTNASVRKGL